MTIRNNATTPLANGEGTYGELAITATPTKFFEKNFDRRSIVLRNMGTSTVYFGYDEDVSDDTGYPIGDGEAVVEDTNGNEIWLVCATGQTSTMRYAASELTVPSS